MEIEENGNKMKRHVLLVAALRIGFSALGLAGAIFIYFLFGVVLEEVANDPTAYTVIKILRNLLPGVVGLVSLLGVISGIGLLMIKKWARILVIIVSAISCFNIPIGTLLGVYSIWVLLQDETVWLFESQG